MRRHPNLGIAFQYRIDGRRVDATEMDRETRIACLMYADGWALFASSEADLQALYSMLAEVLRSEGMLISLSKTVASVYRAWVDAFEWLNPKLYHGDGAKVKEATALK